MKMDVLHAELEKHADRFVARLKADEEALLANIRVRPGDLECRAPLSLRLSLSVSLSLSLYPSIYPSIYLAFARPDVCSLVCVCCVDADSAVCIGVGVGCVVCGVRCVGRHRVSLTLCSISVSYCRPPAPKWATNCAAAVRPTSCVTSPT